MTARCFFFCVCLFLCVCVCVLPGSTDCDSLRDRDTDGCVTHATPINPKTHRNLANAGAGGRGRGFIFPANSFIWLRTEELGQMAPMPLSTKKIAFFGGGLEFRAFNLSATCSTIRTKCLPPYLSHARVSSYSVSARDIYETYLKRRGSRRSDRLLFSCLFTY